MNYLSQLLEIRRKIDEGCSIEKAISNSELSRNDEKFLLKYASRSNNSFKYLLSIGAGIFLGYLIKEEINSLMRKFSDEIALRLRCMGNENSAQKFK